MPSCVVNDCKNNSCFQNKSSGTTFHKFPSEAVWKAKWIQAIRDNRNDADWMPSKFSVICSLHFEDCDINNTKGGLRRVVKNATPIKMKLIKSEWCQEMELSDGDNNSETKKVKLENPDWCQEMEQSGDNIITLTIIPEFKTEQSNSEEEIEVGHKSPEQTEDISMPQERPQRKIHASDLESISDYVENIKLTQRVRMYKTRLQKLVRKIKTLNQNVKRLKKSNASLKNVLKDIKQKKNITKA